MQRKQSLWIQDFESVPGDEEVVSEAALEVWRNPAPKPRNTRWTDLGISP